MERERWIDCAKGILIFLVILGHTIQYANGNEYYTRGGIGTTRYFF